MIIFDVVLFYEFNESEIGFKFFNKFKNFRINHKIKFYALNKKLEKKLRF